MRAGCFVNTNEANTAARFTTVPTARRGGAGRMLWFVFCSSF